MSHETTGCCRADRGLAAEGLRKGQVGTIVEQVAPQVYEVEFSGLDGKTYATAAVSEKLLIRLIHEPA